MRNSEGLSIRSPLHTVQRLDRKMPPRVRDDPNLRALSARQQANSRGAARPHTFRGAGSGRDHKEDPSQIGTERPQDAGADHMQPLQQQRDAAHQIK
jgi:hypothetical protein